MKNVFLFALLSVCFWGCQSNTQTEVPQSTEQTTTFKHTNFELQAGDILFQDSDCGPFCTSIEKVTFGIEGAKFSHVAMVIQKDNGELVALEAISLGVVETPLDSFFNRSFDEDHNSKVVVGRLKPTYKRLIPKAIVFAQQQLGRAYDNVFDITNDKYYCSELIYDAFKHANEGIAIFQLQKMTYKDPGTGTTFPIWASYFDKLNVAIPEGELGLNPGGMSKSNYLNIVHFYGKPQGYTGNMHLSNP